ncbi:MAG: putative hydroxymethylpyrimidine transporter CytX [Treponema sp.]|nr:putative hydroxymethylpyrimidine transporter CytX [Treponema sp.]
MENKGTSVFNNALIWFGAGVSIAEIITGTYFAPLGFSRGLAAILIGHVIGCALLFFAGYIGGIARKSAMETTKYSFGSWGSKFFALLNVLQLVGWTGIMIYDGSLAVNEIFSFGNWIWAIVIGFLIILWIVIGITNLGKINVVTMSLLFILTLVLCKIIFFGEKIADSALEEAMSFGAAVELAVAMPLSWLPLISDYTKESEKPFKATLVSSGIYGIVSCWMYIIGMGAAIFTGQSDIAQIAVKSGLGIVGLVIIVLSTVTTTFLDAFSAGISAKTVFEKLDGKWTAVIVALLGTAGAILFNMDNITDFLYYIGSVFAPMIAILIADFFIVKRDSSKKKLDVVKIVIWLAGFVAYRLLMRVDFILGCTILDMAITFALALLWGKLNKTKN